MTIKIAILVEGGVVQDVICNMPADVDIVDMDNLESEGMTSDQRSQVWDAAVGDTYGLLSC